MPRKRVVDIIVNHEWCKRCGICSSFCPTTVFDTHPDGTVVVARPEACIACELCERMCPDLAIDLVFGDGAKRSASSADSRADAAGQSGAGQEAS